MPYPYRIIKAIESSVRAQITNALNELALLVGGGISDTAYDASWNGSTDVAPSQNAVYDKIEVMVAEADTSTADMDFVIDEDSMTSNLDTKIPTQQSVKAYVDFEVTGVYRHAFMLFDGSTAYYENTAITTSGNIFTLVCRFRIASFTGAAEQKSLLQVQGDGDFNRVSLAVRSSDWATADERGKMLVFIQSSAGANALLLWSNASVLDNAVHTLFFTFNGTAGTASWIMDGVAQDDVAVASRIAPSTATLDSGSSSRILIGNAYGATRFWPGLVGFIGYHDVGGLDWTDFMDAVGRPLDVSESSWSQWGGSQPLLWNPHGQLDNNLGSATDLIAYGSTQTWLTGFHGGSGLVDALIIDEDDMASNSVLRVPTQQSVKAYVDGKTLTSGTFSPTLLDSSLSASEGQTYTEQTGHYRKIGDLCYFALEIIVNSLGTLTTGDNAAIGGLPFVAASLGTHQAVTVGLGTSLALAAANTVSAVVIDNVQYLSLQKWDATTGTSPVTIAQVSTGARLVISGCYITA